MNKLSQNDMEHLIDLVQRREITADEANVLKVRMARFAVVTKLDANVRTVLNAAVKAGELGHKKREGHKPEVYFHPNFEHLANEERNHAEKRALEAIAGVLGTGR
ncbi:hypothetical protein [Paenibacillus graminis]|uniref:Uncharacterized protein n=1 Tax=Paenibacillus graminis TaxID=189425 RepID=A0A089MAV4_9BACL|nr:hypothetical protein [Paenibacillus graminis]AIQ69485.1 hypothetical protein PGRAT_18935 [Paenibacillus graminis]AIQ70380.1 hypothetical protein PGRAT_24165 [Paenibacillus graminis]